MKFFLLKIMIASVLLASCSVTTIDDKTADETPIEPKQKYSLKLEGHDHDIYYRYPEKIMCGAIENARNTIDHYHPIDILLTFPSHREKPLGWGYEFNDNPETNLKNKLHSGYSYGRVYYARGLRDSWTYKRCLSREDKISADLFIDTIRTCNRGNFGIYIEKHTRGISLEGDNGRNCALLFEPLRNINSQGYLPNAFSSYFQTKKIIKAFDNCRHAKKIFKMDYSKKDDALIFSCSEQIIFR